ncbi:MAG: hypothetical protein QM541_12470 [Flavobacterium sp.]|nr:hypothetical protein [Flavobacterium sp.]
MCTHASTAENAIAKIGQKLYPFIADQFAELHKYNEKDPNSHRLSLLFELVENLQHQFESLRNYEVKLVFPSVQLVFNTKDNPDFKPSVNIHELQILTQKKEALIKHLINEVASEAEALKLHKSHPIHAVIFVFNDSFFPEKEAWHNMLGKWNKTCTCFAKATNTLAHHDKLSSYLNHLHGTK